jgi:hypothetical protein
VQEVLQAKQGMCLERENGRDVFGEGQRKEYVAFLTRVGTCKGTEGKVFANVSAGVDTKANTRAAAHSRLVICVFWRMAASAEAPWDAMRFNLRL